MPTKNFSIVTTHGDGIRKKTGPRRDGSIIYRGISLPEMDTAEQNVMKASIDREFDKFLSVCPSLQDNTIAEKPFLECHKKAAEKWKKDTTKWTKACPRCGSFKHKTVKGCRSRRHTTKKVTFPEKPVTNTIICERWIQEESATTENGASSHDNESMIDSDVQNHVLQNDNTSQDNDNMDCVLDFRHWGMTLKEFPDGPVIGWLF